MDRWPHRPRTVEERACQAYETAYNATAGHLNRADRRTIKGRLIVAQAHADGLCAKIAVLEAEVQTLKGGM